MKIFEIFGNSDNFDVAHLSVADSKETIRNNARWSNVIGSAISARPEISGPPNTPVVPRKIIPFHLLRKQIDDARRAER